MGRAPFPEMSAGENLRLGVLAGRDEDPAGRLAFVFDLFPGRVGEGEGHCHAARRSADRTRHGAVATPPSMLRRPGPMRRRLR